MARTNAAEVEGEEAAAAGHVYLLEAAGSAIGGLLTGLVLVRFLSPMQVAALLLVANIVLALLLLVRWTRLRVAAIGTCGVVAAAFLVGLAAPRVEQFFRTREWPGFQVLDARESLYGSLMATETGAMRSVYENGVLAANAPDPEAAEEAVHLALLEHPAPRRVLLVGGSATGAVSEALKHPTVERVDVVELDPELLRLVHERLKQQGLALFHDRRVRVHVGDGRRYVAASRDIFDAIVVIGPDPETAALNRFYTVEFFRAARARLASGGVFSFAVRSQEEALTPELRAFLQSMKKTLDAVFPYVVAIPGDTMRFVAATEGGVLTDRADVLVARLKARGLQTQYVREYFLPFRMAPERMDEARIELAPNAETRINRDFAPIAYYENAVLWSGEFRSVSARWMEAAARLPFLWVLCAAGLISALLALAGLRSARSAALVAMGSTGLTLMAIQVFLLLAFQALCGYVYRELTLLVGLTMAGMAVGAWWGLRRPLKRVAPVQAALACALPLLMAVAGGLRLLEETSLPGWASQVVFAALAAAAGALGGVQF
ncbi:MAG: fused MFS/spermidine synthase, partial [Terracidiphilus sp.]